MNIKLEKDDIIDFFLLYIKDNMDDIDEEKEASKILKKSAIKNKLNMLESKVSSPTLIKYNQFKTSLKDYIRILS